MSNPPRLAVKNRLLEILPSADRERLLAECQRVELDVGEVLREPGEPITEVYFPTGSCISLIAPTETSSLEVAVIGEEGVLGVSVALGINASSQRALVNTAGGAWRIAAAPFCLQFDSNPRLARLLCRYVYVVMAQFSQTAVCTNFHDVTARLARWLLVTGDRTHSENFKATQELISAMLGVRREGVSVAASLLQKRKLIRYARGHVSIVDRAGLEAAACGCYPAARNAYLLHYPGAAAQGGLKS
jgi:CRP-like cAMP-binding protein